MKPESQGFGDLVFLHVLTVKIQLLYLYNYEKIAFKKTNQSLHTQRKH